MARQTKYFDQMRDGFPFTAITSTRAQMVNLKSDTGIFKPEFICIFRNKTIRFIYPWAELHKIGKEINDLLLKNQKLVDELIQTWQRKYQLLNIFCQDIDRLNLKNLSDRGLVSLLDNLLNIFQNQFSIPCLVEFFSLHNEQVIIKKLIKILNKRNELKLLPDYLTTLIVPTKYSFNNEEELDLLKIAIMIKQKRNKKLIEERLRQHVDNYFWIENNYAQGIKLKKSYFVKRINRLIKKDNLRKKLKNIKDLSNKNKQRKRRLIRKLRLDKKTIELLNLIDIFTYIQDRRKASQMKTFYYLQEMLKEIGRRLKLSQEEMNYAVHYEIPEMLLKRKVDGRMLKERMKYCISIETYRNDKYKYKILTGGRAKKFEEKLFGKEAKKKISDLQGICASQGVVVGKAKIIKTIKDFSKIRIGDILVTSMTTPEFVPILKKVKGIVTDEGGITCHAAIISRELAIPCVVGTNIATKILKDEELIEIRAHHGIVKRI